MGVSVGSIWGTVKGTVGDTAGEIVGSVVDSLGNRVDQYVTEHIGGSGTGADRLQRDRSRVDAEIASARQRAANTVAASGLYAASRIAPEGSAYRALSGLTPPMIAAIVIGIIAIIAYGVKK